MNPYTGVYMNLANRYPVFYPDPGDNQNFEIMGLYVIRISEN